MSAGRPAVVLDRDGTINREVDYLADPQDFELIPGSAEAIAALSAAGFAIAVATNQSGIARGMLDEQRLDAIHARMRAELENYGARIDALAYCPHHPTEGAPPYRVECDCRKPASGMVERTLRELDADPSASWVIGDSGRDLVAGTALGLRGILVATGKGEREHARLVSEGNAPEHYAANLAEAVTWLLQQEEGAVR